MQTCARFAFAATVLAATIACDRSSPQRHGSTPPVPPRPTTAAWITATIQARYFADPRVKPWNIDVTTTSDGHVTLRGEIEDADVREAAVRIAGETENVTAVDDLLRVTGQPVATAGRTARRNQAPREEASGPRVERPDLWITTRIQAKFYTDDEVRPRTIDVDARDAVVTLRGAVDSAAARRQAVALARNTDGVRGVRDELQIDPTLAASSAKQRSIANGVDDTRILTEIESKYFLDPAVKRRAVRVAVEDGVVTLRGVVGSLDEQQRAEQIAAETGGVVAVRSDLQIRTDGPGG
jgi:osmotically-inducible protein OsmY